MPSEPVATWLVPLAGHRFDLEDLPLWLADEPIGVVERDGTFNLVIPADIAGQSHEPIRSIAEERVQFINGIGRLLSPSFRPVTLTDRLFGLSADGTVVNTVVAVEGAEMRMKGGTVRLQIGNRVLPDSRQGAAAPFFKAATQSPRARHALSLIGRDRLSWSELYVLFELVQADVGDRMHSMGWVSKAQARLFTRTANSYSTLGLEGRHGKEKGSPPANPMKHADAETMVHDLVRHWLEYLYEKGKGGLP